MRDFFKKYDLDIEQDIKVKYNTKAADYYRRMLDTKANDQNFNEVAPTFKEGRTLIDGC